MQLIEVKNLDYSFGEKCVLKDISCQIYKGETWSIIGKNGAGKSTLIKCLAGLLPFNKGSIHIQGLDGKTLRPKDRAKIIAYVPQANARNFAPYTVFDFVMLGRFPYQGLMAFPSDHDVKIVNNAMDLTDTKELAFRLMPTLSGGELQRVFLAGAVAQQTPVLLLDEPSTFLDPLHQELIRKTLQRIHDEFGTVLLTITHDINAALSNFTNVLAIADKTVLFAGTTSEFRKQGPHILEKVFSLKFSEEKFDNGTKPFLIPQEIPS